MIVLNLIMTKVGIYLKCFFFFFEFRNSQIKTIKSRWKSWCSEYQNFYLVSSNSYTFLLDSLAVSFTSSNWQHGKLLANRKSPLSLTPTAVLCVKWCNPVFGFLGKQNLIECNCICSRLQVNSYRPICDSWNHGFFFFFSISLRLPRPHINPHTPVNFSPSANAQFGLQNAYLWHPFVWLCWFVVRTER